MKITSSILLTSVAFVTTIGCSSGTSSSQAPKTAAGPSKDVALTLKGTCTAQAIPEITKAEGKEVKISEIPQGEYDYAIGEIYVFTENADKTNVEAFVTDTADDAGNFQSQMACTQGDIKSTAATAASPAPSASPASTTLVTSGGELDAYLKMIVNSDGSISTTGARIVFVHKDSTSSDYAIDPAKTDTTVTANIPASQLKDFAPAKQLDNHYFISDKGLTIIARQGLSQNSTRTFDFIKLVFKKAAPAAAPSPSPSSAQ